MVKEKRILSYILGWFLVGYIIFVIGTNNVLALEDYEDVGYIDNYTLYYVVSPLNGSETPQLLPQNQEWNLENNVSAFILNIDNYNFDADINYNIEISMPLNTLTNANTYTVTTSNNKTCNVGLMDLTNPHYPNFRFKCSEATNSISLKIFNNNSQSIVNAGWFRWNYTYLRKLIDKNDEIIKGQEEIKDAIIDSNKETQDVIKDQFNTCRDSYNLFKNEPITLTNLGLTMTNDGKEIKIKGNVSNDTNYPAFIFFADGSVITTQWWPTSATINSTKGYFTSTNKEYVISLISSGVFDKEYFAFTIGYEDTYDQRQIWNVGNATINVSSDKPKINYIAFGFRPGQTVDLTFKIQIQEGTTSKPYEPYGKEICTNKIDETNDKLDKLEDTLTDSSPTDMSGLSDSAGWLPAGPVDSILTLPLTMLNSLVNNLTSNSCQSINIELPFVKENLTLPCVKSLYDKMGVTGSLFTTAGLIASAFILFNYLLNLYQWVDSTLTMRENTMPGYFDDNWGGGA